MIISHKYKFIFIKTGKTAGTSIEVDLNPHLSTEDIATPVFPHVDGHVPRNFELKGQEGFFSNHMSAEQIRGIIGPDMFASYFVFCVEREPVDKCISHYSMFKNSPDHSNDQTKRQTFSEYLNVTKLPNDVAKYTSSNGSLMVDRILKYENLEDDLRDVCDFLGFDFKLTSRVKSGFRESIDVSHEQRVRIYDEFSDSLKFTGYTL